MNNQVAVEPSRTLPVQDLPSPSLGERRFLRTLAERCPPGTSVLMPESIHRATELIVASCVRNGWLDEFRSENLRVWTLTNSGRQAIGQMLN